MSLSHQFDVYEHKQTKRQLFIWKPVIGTVVVACERRHPAFPRASPELRPRNTPPEPPAPVEPVEPTPPSSQDTDMNYLGTLPPQCPFQDYGGPVAEVCEELSVGICKMCSIPFCESHGHKSGTHCYECVCELCTEPVFQECARCTRRVCVRHASGRHTARCVECEPIPGSQD